ncbi:fibronectin type-III domain-containing protein 3A-like isoform X1 [Stegostoma tigrinum]|uniref:fibronectin type-III domain-containing protein 3A-like isoform X1 n=1 Tax=Stegostoma tigrinum TaxID=3053191 RepID=UPI00202B3316|nr:fibronectin type-III domain-containing protein 3A-like isoform X1 [Stegostoma tigrinum]XP_048400440.1 fibronectin type-III domain-containing protein 3A-like isoform X1 [Stegostoma tigrinum]XP_048400441.1 fibronectin type-III domain-containing protein 3A-like isoform X1 [Stegostoma tigrinum]XP_059507477.1 fibronectin type-III domain-containing protein 3A-like isoform X1 [Stegostoma tigrinum]
MNIPVIMAEQPPLESTLINDVPLLPHLVNGDSGQQVILVQVNPGETFTIRTEDGHIQCIQGPAHVPMMSPNGSMPPIYVPPGYVSQVIEENGVRRVVVLPHSTEFHPNNHPSMHPPPPHVPHYMHHHPALIPHPHQVYAPGTGDIPPQFIPQHPPPPHVFADQESRSPHGRSNFNHRDERTLKVHERLQKRLKERQVGGQKDKPNSPPSSPHKSHSVSPTNVQNGYGKGQAAGAAGTAAGPVKLKPTGKVRSGPQVDAEAGDSDSETKLLQEFLSGITKPVVSEIKEKSVVLSWDPPSISVEGENNVDHLPASCTYEVTISSSEKSGKFKVVYLGEKTTVTISELRPATDYHVRVAAICNSVKGSISEAANFTTEISKPDTPALPKLISRTKNSLSLQWKAPNDGGSKISSYLLEWDEGKQSPFKECYFGYQKQYKLTKLSPSVGCTFRLAAKNDIGLSDFSETVQYYTAGSVPPVPDPPQLIHAAVTWMSLEWSRPSGVLCDEPITYILEMEDESSGYGFKAKYNGDELSCTLKNLRRSTSFNCRVFACNNEGKSNPSEVVKYCTCPDKPGPPSKPSIKGKVQSSTLKTVWDPPKDNGGSEITKYVLELSEGLNENKWDMVYNGLSREHVCDHLKAGTLYRMRVYCISSGGPSQVSEVLTVQTAAVVPGHCQPLRVSGKAKAREVALRWAPPMVTGGSTVTEYSVEIGEPGLDDRRLVYKGPELECTVGSLLPGKKYRFWVKAANKVGYGPCSDSTDIPTAAAPPDQCNVPVATCKTATCVHVHWECPPSNGSEITEFRLEFGGVEGCMQVIYCGPALSYEVKSLTPATAYYCRVQAVNAAGAGYYSDTAICMTPASVPAAVSVLQTIDEDQLSNVLPSPSTCLAIQWEEPCCHGSEVIGYNIEYGDKQIAGVSNVTSAIIEDLQPDTAYRIRVQAVNSIGAGPFSHSIKAKTKPLPPEPPHLECAVFSYQSLKLKWGDGPNKALTTNSTQYTLQMEDKFGRFISVYSGPCHTYKIQRLNESSTYNFRIQAHNDAGEGPFSEVYTFTTTKSPPPPLKAPRVQMLDENTCEVMWEALQPMKGDAIVYTLQIIIGRETEQVYRGPETSFRLTNFQTNCEYRFKVCAVRQYQDAAGMQELYGPYSPIVPFSSQRQESASNNTETAVELTKVNRETLTDEQFAALIVAGFAVVSILFAFIIQYFVIK